MRAGIITFPGSNCDRDIEFILARFFDAKTQMLWHAEPIHDSFDLIVLPGGFSYGDYLRTGAIAKFAPAMNSVAQLNKKGVPVIGICNGFQILCEANLLPGALIRNMNLKHICKDVILTPEKNPFTVDLKPGTQFRIPVSHGEGNFRATEDGLKEIEDNGQVAFRYLENPNGSLNNIAGISDRAGRVFGMMPHPERAVDPVTGGTDGAAILRSILNACAAPV